MEYFIECKAIQSYHTIPVLNANMEEVGSLSFDDTDDYDVKIHVTDEGTLFATSNRLMPHKRYQIYQSDNTQVGTVKVGVKIIHSIIEHSKYLVAKASFWKLQYNLFDNRTLVGNLHLVKIRGTRFFSITSDQNDFISVFGLFLLAHAVRIKAILG